MKNSDFLSWFNNLNRTNTKENILSSANNIISSLSLEEEKTLINKEKYRFYLKVFNTQNEDLLYTINRLIGGICSTATDFRQGFGITLQLFLDKFINEINISELLEGIQKESYVPKNEKNNIRLAALSGKLFVYKILLNLHNLSEENLIFMMKQILNIAKGQKLLEEACIVLIEELFNKIFNEYYDIKKNKNNKLLEGIFKSLDNICEHKNNFSEVFIFMNYFDNIKGFISPKIIEEFFENKNEESNQPLFKYFCGLLNLPIKYQNINNKDANIFNFSLKFLYQTLIKLNNAKYAYKIWNILIDEKCVEQFNKISSKNFESLIYTYSLFLLQNFFDLKFSLQIFDESFFLSLVQFQSNKKVKYAINITDIISEKIKNIKDNDEIIEKYCKKCLKIFGSEVGGRYLPKTLKNFYMFLLRKISDEEKNKYINDLLDLNEDKSIEDIQFNLNALKIIYIENTNNKIIEEETKNKIIVYFLKNYYSDSFDVDIAFSYSIEEMTLNLILNLIKPEFVQNKLVPIKSSKAISILINLKEEYLKSTKSRVIVKFGLILLFLYLKHPEDFEEDINDLIGILEHNFDKEWMKVFTALCLNLLHKGSPLINDLVMNEYKKMSNYIGKDGYDVIVEYLKDTRVIKDKKKETNEINLDENEDDI